MPRKEKEENWFLDSSVTRPALKGRFRISPGSGVFMECEFSLEPESRGFHLTPESRINTSGGGGGEHATECL